MQRIITLLIIPVVLTFLAFSLYRSHSFQNQPPISPQDLTPVRADTLSVTDPDADVSTALSTLRDLYTDLLSRFDSFTQSSSTSSSAPQTTVYAPFSSTTDRDVEPGWV
jgi:hypothetical protein